MPSPFRTSPQLGPDLMQVVPGGNVWFDPKNIVSPKVGTKETGDDGHHYILVQASAAIAPASPGTAVVITEPAMTAAAGAGGFTAPVAGVAINGYFWARSSTL